MWCLADAESEAAVAAALDKAMRTSGRAVLVIAHRCTHIFSSATSQLFCVSAAAAAAAAALPACLPACLTPARAG